jgi:copper chaperone NosL
MKHRWDSCKAAAVLFAISVALVGCSKKIEQGPPVVHFGEDVCAACGMILSDERFAGAIVIHDETGERQSYLYDDIGGMASDVTARSTGSGNEFFVHDYLSREWIDAAQAFFVRTDALSTPMAWGIAAFRSRSDAQKMIDEIGGDLLTWDEVQKVKFKQVEPGDAG